MPNKIFSLLKLARVNNPTGYWLVFFPTFFGQMLAYSDDFNFKLLFLLFTGSILTRSAGSIINDIIDRKFDKKVERTQFRPLVSGQANLKEAILISVLLLLASLAILITLPSTAIYIGILAFIMMLIYPFMKRITYFPQLFLGFTFNLGCLIGYSSSTGKITLPAVIMYLACCFWTLGYDTIYGFMDIKDDKKIGIKSLAIFIEDKNCKIWLYFFYTTFIFLFAIANSIASSKLDINILDIFFILITLYLEVYKLDIYNPNDCLKKFKSNSYIGLWLSLAMIF